jgi:hypothetical protein
MSKSIVFARIVSIVALVFVVPAILVALVPFIGAFALFVSVPAMVLAGLALVIALRQSESHTIILALAALLLGAAASGLAYEQIGRINSAAQGLNDAAVRTEEGIAATGEQVGEGARDMLLALKSGFGEMLNEAGTIQLVPLLTEEVWGDLALSLRLELDSVQDLDLELEIGPAIVRPVAAEHLAKLKAVESPLTPGRYLGDPGRDFIRARSPGEGPAGEEAPILPVAVVVYEGDQMSICKPSQRPDECDLIPVRWFEDSRGRLRLVFAMVEEASLIGRFELSEASNTGFTILFTDEYLQEWSAAQNVKDGEKFAAIPLRFAMAPEPGSAPLNRQSGDTAN